MRFKNVTCACLACSHKFTDCWRPWFRSVRRETANRLIHGRARFGRAAPATLSNCCTSMWHASPSRMVAWATIYTDRCYGKCDHVRAVPNAHAVCCMPCSQKCVTIMPQVTFLHARGKECSGMPHVTCMPEDVQIHLPRSCRDQVSPSTHGVAEEACGPKDAATMAVDVAFERVRE